MNYEPKYKCKHYWEDKDDNGNIIKKNSMIIEADDAHNDIDIEAIVTTCGQMIEKAEELKYVDSMVKLYTSSITKDALCVNDTTVEGISNECHEYVKNKIDNIIAEIEGIQNKAIARFNDQQEIYNSIAIEKHRRMPSGSCQGKINE